MFDMFRAAINDLAQRVLTLNKFEQRLQLRRFIAGLDLPEPCRVLDFGCGTALFAPLFLRSGQNYVGYDIDPALLAYARRLYPPAGFTSSKDELRAARKFDLILINCCTHHIPDPILDNELDNLKTLLGPGGVCLLVDILKVDPAEDTLPHRCFMKLEKGEFVRFAGEYEAFMARHFKIIRQSRWRSHFFSLPLKLNPLYNDLNVIAGTE